MVSSLLRERASETSADRLTFDVAYLAIQTLLLENWKFTDQSGNCTSSSSSLSSLFVPISLVRSLTLTSARALPDPLQLDD